LFSQNTTYQGTGPFVKTDKNIWFIVTKFRLWHLQYIYVLNGCAIVDLQVHNVKWCSYIVAVAFVLCSFTQSPDTDSGHSWPLVLSTQQAG